MRQRARCPRDTHIRLRILRALGALTLTSAEASALLGITYDHASHTLRQLADAGVCTRRREYGKPGTEYRYQLAVPVVWRDRTDRPATDRGTR